MEQRIWIWSLSGGRGEGARERGGGSQSSERSEAMCGTKGSVFLNVQYN